MPLSPGGKLGHYEILAPIGAGGMGEVYKARDPRLDRTVAIKVLPEHIAKREDLKARFEREARAVASLNHPHICVLHDIGEEQGMQYMVLEYLEGETLEARLQRGALPLDTALQYAMQTADALDRAHRAGVAHRDVKPGNLMLTRDGIKVLDFGLAKSKAKPGPTEATLVASLTSEGTVLGTPQYMAPELFEGKEADARADVWAFGAVLYEMVTGRKAFEGKNYSSLVGAILSTEPAPVAPGWLDRLVRRCLQKDPDERYQSIRDVLLDLKDPAPAVEPQPAPAREWRIWALACVCLIAGIATGALIWKRPPVLQPITFEVQLPGPSGDVHLSPDGRTMAYAGLSREGGSALFLRNMATLEGRELPGTNGVASEVFWSPDSSAVAFQSGGKLKLLDLRGSAPVELCDVRSFRGGSWGPDGVILFADQETPGVHKVAVAGGAPVPVTRLNSDAGERSHYHPQFLPGGKSFLYLNRNREVGKSWITVGSLEGKPPVALVQSETSGMFDANSGLLLYTRDGSTVVGQRLQVDPPRLTGEPRAVAAGVRRIEGDGRTTLSLSGNGILAFSRAKDEKLRFVWKDRTGKVLQTVGEPHIAGLGGIDLSTDATRVAYSAGRNPSTIWTMDMARGTTAQVSLQHSLAPIWSPDGTWLYYNSARRVVRKRSDGSGEEEVLAMENALPHSVSPDGRFLLYGSGNLNLLALTGEKKTVPFLETRFREDLGRFSPDGNWIAFVSNESGRQEVYLQGLPGRHGKWRVSENASTARPQWRGDGKEIYWKRATDEMWMATPVTLRLETAELGRPEPLFAAIGTRIIPARNGQRFLVMEPEDGGQVSNAAVVMVNWAAGITKQ